jgi:hypothetical protein
MMKKKTIRGNLKSGFENPEFLFCRKSRQIILFTKKSGMP